MMLGAISGRALLAPAPPEQAPKKVAPVYAVENGGGERIGLCVQPITPYTPPGGGDYTAPVAREGGE